MSKGSTLTLDTIQKFEEGTPFTVNDLKTVVPNTKEETLRVLVARLVNKNILKRYDQGIFYRPQISIFGEIPLSRDAILKKFYLEDGTGGTEGYFMGADFLNEIGAANNLPNRQELVTNHYLLKTPIQKMKNPPQLIRPKIKITADNASYLQLLDTLNHLERYHLTVQDFEQFLFDFIQDLDVLKLIGYAKMLYPKKVLIMIEEAALRAI